MSWLFEYCTDGSIWVEIDEASVPIESVRHVTQRHRDLEPSTDTFELAVRFPTVALLNAILSSNAFEFRSSKAGSSVFRGWVSTEATAEIRRGRKDRISIKAYDESWLLDKKIGSTINWQNYYVQKSTDTTHSIVHQLLLLYGLDASRILPTNELTQIDYFVADPDETFEQLLTQLLFELGWIYYFDADGNFKTEAIFPDDVTTATTFDDDNMSGLSVEKKPVQHEAVEVTYWAHQTITDALVSSDTTDGDEVNKANISMADGAYYPTGSGTTDVYTQFSVTDRELICALNGEIDASYDTGISQSSPTWYPTKLLVNFHNTAGAAKNLKRFDVIADAVVKGDKGITRVYNSDQIQADMLQIEARWITTSGQAQYLCSGTALYYNFSSISYSFNSRTLVAPGTIVQLSSTAGGISQVCRVYARSTTWQLDGTALYEYAIEGVAAYSLQTIVAEGSHDQPPSLPRPQLQAIEGAMTRYDFLNGFMATGGTTTPTVPTIQVCSGVYHGIILLWDRQLNLLNFDHYEVQVSDDSGTHWYALKFDETDWKGTENAVTVTKSEFLVHTGLGTETLQYHVKRVTKAASASAYSSYVEGTASDVSDASAAFDNLYVNKLVVGQLQAIFAQVTSELIIGASYTVGQNPAEGDQKVVVHNNLVALMEYSSGAWVTLWQIGGSTLITKWYLQARGIVQVGADLSTIDLGDPMPAGFKRFKFDADYKDELGADPWTTKTNTSFVTDTLFKRGSVLQLATGDLHETATNVWTQGTSCAVDLYARYTSFGSGVLFQFGDTSANYFQVLSDSSGTIRAEVIKNSVSTYIESSIVDGSKARHISAGYDSVTDKMYLVVDGAAVQSVSAIGGSWTGGSPGKWTSFGGGGTWHFGDVIFNMTAILGATLAASIAKAQAHYALGQPWSLAGGIDSTKDVLLLAKSGGSIRLLSPTSYYAPVITEPSLGTPHPHVYTITTTGAAAAGNYYEADFVAQVPAGTKEIVVCGWLLITSANIPCEIRNSAGTIFGYIGGAANAGWAVGFTSTKVILNGDCKVRVFGGYESANTAFSSLRLTMTEYYQ